MTARNQLEEMRRRAIPGRLGPLTPRASTCEGPLRPRLAPERVTGRQGPDVSAFPGRERLAVVVGDAEAGQLDPEGALGEGGQGGPVGRPGQVGDRVPGRGDQVGGSRKPTRALAGAGGGTGAGAGGGSAGAVRRAGSRPPGAGRPRAAAPPRAGGAAGPRDRGAGRPARRPARPGQQVVEALAPARRSRARRRGSPGGSGTGSSRARRGGGAGSSPRSWPQAGPSSADVLQAGPGSRSSSAL